MTSILKRRRMIAITTLWIMVLSLGSVAFAETTATQNICAQCLKEGKTVEELTPAPGETPKPCKHKTTTTSTTSTTKPTQAQTTAAEQTDMSSKETSATTAETTAATASTSAQTEAGTTAETSVTTAENTTASETTESSTESTQPTTNTETSADTTAENTSADHTTTANDTLEDSTRPGRKTFSEIKAALGNLLSTTSLNVGDPEGGEGGNGEGEGGTGEGGDPDKKDDVGDDSALKTLGLSLSAGDETVAPETALTLTATVSGVEDGVNPTGSLIFKQGDAQIGDAVAVTGNGAFTATASWSNAEAGDYTFSVDYQPGTDDPYAAASGSAGVKVGQPSEGDGGEQLMRQNRAATNISTGYTAALTFNPTPPVYTGAAIVPATITVTDTATNTVLNSAYYVATYADNTNVGTATVTITGRSGYVGAFTTTFAIAAKPIDGLGAELDPKTFAHSGTNYVHTGSEIKPGIIFKDGTKTLVEGTDYDLAYLNNTDAGTATVTATAKGNYSGTKALTFTIAGADANLTINVTGPTEFVYDGTAKTLTFTVKDNGTDLDASKYTATYTNNINVGTATLTILVNGTARMQTKTFTITKPTTTNLILNASMVGSVMHMTATVQNSVSATGKVTFTITSPSQQTYTQVADMVNGTATSTQGGIFPAQYTVVATYTGDTNYPAATSNTVNFWAPNVRLSISGSSDRGEYTTVLVTVTGSAGYGRVPTGYVSLTLDGRKVADLRLDSNGQATYTLWNHNWGRGKLIATYAGDAIYSAASSDPLTLWDDDKYFPSIKLTSAVGSGSKATTLTATVYGYAWQVVPSGYVDFYKGDTHLGTVRLDRYGEAVFTWKNVPNGTHKITAVYLGDDMYRTVSITETITKRGSSSSGGSGGSSGNKGGGSSSTGQGSGQPYEVVQLRDPNGAVLDTYNTTTLTMQADGVMLLETADTLDYYSYGFPVSRLNEFSNSQQNGYFNIVTPTINVHMPYNLPSGLTGMADYLQQNNLQSSQVELRLIVRKINDSSLRDSYAEANPGTSAVSMYRVEVALYSSTGKRLDFVPELITVPMQLLVATTVDAGTAGGYDEVTRSFFPVEVAFGNDVMMLTIDRNGVYIIGQ